MKTWRLSPILVAGVLASPPAWADASAMLTINQKTLTLSTSGNIFYSPINDVFRVTLAPGESRDFTFEYAAAVRDDGLPVPRPEGLVGNEVFRCAPVTEALCPPAYTGHEFAMLHFAVAAREPRYANRNLQLTSDAPTSVTLQTHPDSFADVLQQSGTIHVHITNTSPLGPQTDFFAVYGFAWVLAVPEPSTWALLLGGLLAVSMRARRELCALASTSSGVACLKAKQVSG